MADWEEELGLKNVRPFDKPMTAGQNDKVVGQDELGQTIYETATGQRYTVRPATAEESKTTRTKAEEWFEKGAPLPTGEEVLETLKNIPSAAYESAANMVRGEGTYGDVIGAVTTMAAPGAGNIAKGIAGSIDPSIVSAMGATYRAPRYTTNTVAEESIQFRDPLFDVFQEMELPAQGIKGSQLIKELQDNPTVRNSQLKSQEIFDRVDAQKRYTKDEIEQLFSSSSYDVRAVPYNNYSAYQRQFNLVDEEVPGGYVEYAIEANTTSPNQKNFKAESQHYSDQTLAHVRLSERQSGNRRYVLIEELQSDLLQQGFLKPTKDWNVLRGEYIKNIDDPTRFHVASKITADDIKAYTQTAMDLEDDFLKSYYGTTNRDEIWEKGEDFYVRNKVLEKAGLDPNDRLNRALVGDILFELSEVIPLNSVEVTVPPVAKTEETVRLGIETAIAHAAQNGMTSVVIPPFEEIVKKRFTDPKDIAKAMDPKSGFYATYVKGVEKVLKDLKVEYGDAIKVDSIDLEYDPNKSQFDFGEPDELIDEDAYTFTSPEQMFFDENFKEIFADRVQGYMPNRNVGFGRRAFNRINEIGEKIVNRGDQTVLDVLGPEDYDFYSAFRDAVRDAYPDVNFIGSFQQMVDENISLTQAMFDQVVPKPKPKAAPVTERKQGIEIDFEGLVNQGYDLTRPRFAEGGMVENIDPISGNEVPPGAKPEEVRDDVPIMASEGEYVIPANVVRYIGLDRIEKMVKQAKKGLEELDAEGRIGGASEDDLPFSAEELQAVDEQMPAPSVPQMAEGGLVTPNVNNFEIDPATGLPLWLLQMQRQQAQPTATPAPTPAPVAPVVNETTTTVPSNRSRDNDPPPKPVGLARPVNEWAVEDYGKYARYRNSPEAGIFKAATSLVPFGGLLSGFAQRSTERAVSRNLTEMIQSGKDLNGNPLSTDQLTKLKETYTKIITTPMGKSGIASAARSILDEVGITDPKKATPEQVARYNQRVQGDGLVNKVVDFLTGSNKPIVAPRTTPAETGSSASRDMGSIGTKTASSKQDRDSEKTRVNTSGKTGGSASISFSKNKTDSPTKGSNRKNK